MFSYVHFMFYTYIIANSKHGAIFTGQCDDLSQRMREHKIARLGRAASTLSYSIDRLMWFEAHPTRDAAVKREREIKKWSRKRRLALFEDSNPDWIDLAADMSEAALYKAPPIPANVPTAYQGLALAS
jgi:putative endonuclease